MEAEAAILREGVLIEFWCLWVSELVGGIAVDVGEDVVAGKPSSLGLLGVQGIG